MKVTLTSTSGDLNYLGTNERGQTASFSGSKTAVSPMEHVLMAAAACSSIDIEIFLKKMRSPATRIEVEVTGTRADAVPAVFTHIHLHYRIFGEVKESKAKKAVAMSMDQYCSVSIMLKAAVEITYDFELQHEE